MKFSLLLACALLALAVGLPVEEDRETRDERIRKLLPQPVYDQGRGCIYILGRCGHACEEGTHSYSVGCGHITSERTCDNPVSTLDTRGMICDYSRCECDEPKVKDLGTGKCVLLEDCPKREAGAGNHDKVDTHVEDKGDRV